MTAPVAPEPLGARTWEAPEEQGAPASPRSQVAAAAIVCGAILLVAGLAPALGWGIAFSLALVAGIAVGLLLPPIPLLRKMSGIVLAVIVIGASLILITLSWSVLGLTIPPAVAPLLALVALGLDWRRADRLRPVVTLTGAPVLLVALSEEPWAIGASIVWLAAAFGTYTMLEGDRRASLPRVQPDARGEAMEARPDDLLTTLLIAAAIALLAALVLSVPSCQQRLRGPQTPDASIPDGSGSASGGGSGSGSGSPSGEYVPDPDGRFLVPRDAYPDGSASGSGAERVPSPEDVPDGLAPGDREVRTTPDGTTLTYERGDDGDVTVTVTDPDGTTTEWRFHERSDGLVEIDRIEPDGSVGDRWWYDPDGQVAQGSPDADGSSAPPPEPPPEEERDKPDLATIGRVLGGLVLLGLLAWLGWWWWRRRHPDDGGVAMTAAPPWALVLAARIDAAGAERGHPRPADETVVRYGRSLASGPLPDGRLTVVAEVVSDALFSGIDPGPTVATWAQSTFDEIVAAHPVPGRREARRGSGEPVEV